MNAQPNANNPQATVEDRLRTLRTLWIGLVLSIGGYFVVTLFAQRSEDLVPNPTLSLVLLGGCLTTTLASFLIKSKLLNRAIEQQQPPMVQQAYIVGWAIMEAGALLGVLDYFLAANRYYYVLFIIAAVGQLLHFPRREHVVNSAGTKPIY
jgi:drug/metabolite transporter (DMT)-like permease